MTLAMQIIIALAGLVLLARDLLAFWDAGASPGGVERRGLVRWVRLAGSVALIAFAFWLPNGVEETARIVCNSEDAVERSNAPAGSIADSAEGERRAPLAEHLRWLCEVPAPPAELKSLSSRHVRPDDRSGHRRSGRRAT